MKDVRYDSITAQARQPFVQETHQWYNDMSREGFLGLLQSLLPASWYSGKLVFLNGAGVVVSGGTYTCASGYAFFNGEMFIVSNTVLTPSGSNVACWEIVEVNDSIKFSDNSFHPVHRNRLIILSEGVSGSGSGLSDHTYICDYGDPIAVNYRKKSKVVVEQPSGVSLTTSTSRQPVILTSITEDTNAEYNTSNGRFTPKVAGWYRFCCTCSIYAGSGGSLNGNITVGFEVNGVGPLLGASANVLASYGNNFGLSSSTMIHMSSLDYVRLMYSQSQPYASVGGDFSIQITLEEAD